MEIFSPGVERQHGHALGDAGEPNLELIAPPAGLQAREAEAQFFERGRGWPGAHPSSGSHSCKQACRYNTLACAVTGPGLPSPTGRPSIRVTGVTPPSVPVTKASLAE